MTLGESPYKATDEIIITITRSMDQVKAFQEETRQRIEDQGNNTSLIKLADDFMIESTIHKYSYNFSWMGRPIIQYPQDILAMQEIIWEVKPDLIIETGIAHGGSLIFYASLLELLGKGEVLGVDIDIRSHNRVEIEKHSMFKRIKMIQGSSIDELVISQVKAVADGKLKVMVVLDSNHTHEHVLRELQLYAPLVTTGSYLVVFDTIVEYLPNGYIKDRPWSAGNNPKTAVTEFLRSHPEFVVDEMISKKLLISVAPDGYLKKVF